MTLARKKLPSGLVPQGSTRVFSDGKIPTKITNEHSLAKGKWGALHILQGSVVFVDVASKQEIELIAPDVFIIPPEDRHFLKCQSSVKFRIDFFRSIDDCELVEDSEDRKIVSESFQRCEATGNFADVFYDMFLKGDPEVAAHFAQTNFKTQRILLRGTVYIMVTRNLQDESARSTLEGIGQSHSREALAIQPQHYENWLASLCDTVKSLDPNWTESIEQSWLKVLRPCIQLISAHY